MDYGGLSEYKQAVISYIEGSQPPPTITFIITTTTNYHFYHHNNHQLSLLSSQQPPTITSIITTATNYHFYHHNHHQLSLLSSQPPPTTTFIITTTYWNSSMLSHFSGASSKVPVLSNDLHQNEWTAMGKILLKGYADTKYFPVQIVRAIVMQSLSGQEMDGVVLVSSLMEVMSEVDQGLVENIRNGQLADNDEEMIDDFIIRVRSDSYAKRELD